MALRDIAIRFRTRLSEGLAGQAAHNACFAKPS
jgi:hypothetical protein